MSDQSSTPDGPPSAPRQVLQDHDHNHCVAHVRARIAEISAANDLNLTPVRQRVLEILLENHVALGAYEILKRLDAEGFGSQPPVVYRALEFLMTHGFVHKIERLNAFVACMHPDHGHNPAFLICRSCRAVAETYANADQLSWPEARPNGFQIERVVIEAEGLCPKCQTSPASA